MSGRTGSVRLSVAAAALCVLAACGTASPSASPGVSPEPSPTATEPDASEPAGPSPEVDISTPAEILQAILDQVAAETGVSADEVTVLRAEAVTWRDGSLGCPKPGELYIQVLIDGYWVVLQAGDNVYDFRVDNQGNFRLCPPGRGQLPFQP